MYYLLFDIANKSLAINLLYFNNNYKDELKGANLSNLEDLILYNKKINNIIKFEYYAVIDLIPNQKVVDTTVLFRTNKLKIFLKELNIFLNNTIEKKNIENIKLLIEYQPSFNDKSKTIYNQIIYEFSDNPIYDIVIMNPLYKNKIYFSKDLKHSKFIQKYNNNYIANKNHAKANFLYFLKEFNLEYVIKNIKKKNIDDLSDSFMQIFGYLQFIHK